MEGRVASDQELKLTELLRYYMRDIQAAKVRLLSSAFIHCANRSIVSGRECASFFYFYFSTKCLMRNNTSTEYFYRPVVKEFCLFLFAQDLLYRRARALADYENSNKALDKARLKGKDVPQAEENQQQCLQKFDKLSESGKKGLCVGL